MKSDEAKRKKLYVERDISWMYFNQRILLEAARPEVPLLEQLTFLGIYSNNLDEFFRVRVATLNRIVEYDDKNIREERDTAARTLKQIGKLHNQYYRQFEETFASIMEKLKQENIHVIKDTELTPEQEHFITSLYRNRLNGSTNPLFLTKTSRHTDDQTDEDIYLAIRLLRKDSEGKVKMKDYAVIGLPTAEFGRFIRLPDSEGKTYLMFLDDVIRYCLPMIFIGMNYTDYEAYTFKFTKDAEMEIDSDLRTGVLQKISKGIKSRKRGEPIRFVYDKEMPKDLLRKLTDRLNVDKNDTRVAGGRYHNFKDLMKFPDCGRSDLKYPAWPPRLQTGTERDGKYPETDQKTGPVAALPLSIVRYRDPCIARGSHQQRSEKHQDDSLSPGQRLEGSESSDLRRTKRKKSNGYHRIARPFRRSVQHQLEQTHARGRNQSDIRSGRSENPLQAGTYRNTVWRPGLYQHRKFS